MSSIVFITGGAGFIGRHLSKVLIGNGYQLRILDPLMPQVHGSIPADLEWLDNPNIEFIRGSILDRTLVERALDGASIVVHLAAETGTGQSMYQIEKYTNTNVTGTALILDILANTKQRTVEKFVLASSRSVYGEGGYCCAACGTRTTPDARLADQLQNEVWDPLCQICSAELTAVATTEDDLIKPASIYASTKYAQEDLVKIACGSLDIGYSIFRLQNVYGEGQSLNNPYTGILSIFSTRIRKGIELPIFEDGMETRDFVHVSDVVGAIAQCLENERMTNGVANVGSGIASSVIDVATTLNSVLGGKSDIRITKEYRLGDIRHNFADIERLKVDVGYTPTMSLHNGLAQFVEWVMAQPLPEDRLEIANAELRSRNLMG